MKTLKWDCIEDSKYVVMGVCESKCDTYYYLQITDYKETVLKTITSTSLSIITRKYKKSQEIAKNIKRSRRKRRIRKLKKDFLSFFKVS